MCHTLYIHWRLQNSPEGSRPWCWVWARCWWRCQSADWVTPANPLPPGPLPPCQPVHPAPSPPGYLTSSTLVREAIKVEKIFMNGTPPPPPSFNGNNDKFLKISFANRSFTDHFHYQNNISLDSPPRMEISIHFIFFLLWLSPNFKIKKP